MKPQHYLAIAVKIFAIFLFINSIQQSRMLSELLINGYISNIAVPIWFAVIVSLFPFLVSAFLWFFPLTVSQFILTNEINHPIEPIHSSSLLAVLISAIGLFFLYYAISDTVYWATVFKMYSVGTSNGASIELPQDASANVLSTIIELALSLVFIFKAKTLASQLIKVAK